MKMEKEKKRMTLLTLAIPILLEQILRSLMGTVNTFMLSRFSDEASAAVGVANQILNVVIIASTMLASGAAVVVNQNLGAGKKREAAQITMNSVSVSAVIGFALSLFTVSLSGRLVRMMGLEENLIGDAAVYLRIVGISCVIQFVSAMIATHFRCRGKAQVSMLVIAFNNAVNLLGSFLVIEGKLPVTGVAGIACVRLFSEAMGLLLIGGLFARQEWDLRRGDLLHIKGEYLKQIVSLGFMSGMEGVSFTLAQLVTTRFITALPTAVLSAKVYTQTINNYTYMAGLSIGQAAQILAGHLIGAGKTEEVYRFIRKSWLYIFLCNLAFSGGFFLCSSRLVGLFTDSAEIRDIARMLFFIDIFICAGRSLNHSFNYGLRSAGYVFWPMVIANTSIWIVSVGMGYVLTVPLGFGIVGLWAAQSADEWFRGLCAMMLWLKKKWVASVIVKRES